MHEGYGSHFVCLLVSVPELAATHSVYEPKVKRYSMSCRLYRYVLRGLH